MMKIKGIDISYCQRDVDYQKVKAAGIDFAIVRSGYKEKTDDMLYTHLNGCKKAGIPVGIYVYAMARTVDDAVKEAKYCLQSVAGRELLYPVFYDLEDDRLLDLTSKQRTDNAVAFLEEIKNQGYCAGVYVNPAWLEQYLEKDRLTSYDLWLAAWTENPDKPTKYNYNQTIWQWGLDNVDGISGTGAVDGDLCYADYPAIIKAGEYNNNNQAAETNTAVISGATFRTVNKNYRCIGSSVNKRRFASDNSAVIGKLIKNKIYTVTSEVYKDGKLKWLAADGGYSMYIDQVGARLFEEAVNSAEYKIGDLVKILAPYAASAFVKTASNKKAVGEARYITKIFDGANYPYMLGVKAGDISSGNTTGFAGAGGIVKI